MGYYIDLSGITIDSYKEKLRIAYLPPSRMILKEMLDTRFNYFKQSGIENVKQLLDNLKKKDRLDEFSKIECLSLDYLRILLREIKSIHPKPNRIRDFPGISPDTVSSLENIGIKNTLKLYDKVVTQEGRSELALITGISESEILELTKLSDLSRIKWVGVTFARMLHDIGIDTTEKASIADAVNLHQKINQLNREKKIYRAQIGLNDVRIFINAAKEIPLDIEY